MSCSKRLHTTYTQYTVLSTKHALIYVRRIKATLGILVCPIAIVLLLLAFQAVSNYVLDQSEPEPNPVAMGPILPCVPHNGMPCKVLAYCPQGVPWVDALMSRVATDAGLDPKTALDSSICPVHSPYPSDIDSAIAAFTRDNATLSEYILHHPNQTQNAVLMYSAYMFGPEYGTELPPEVGYILFYNATKRSRMAAQVKIGLDAAELSMRAGVPVTMDIAGQDFPKPKLRIAGYDVVAANGGVWLFVPPMVIFFMILVAVVQEKQDRHRVGMRMMGLTSFVYWGTWLQTAVVFITLSTGLLMATGAACGFDFFLRANAGAVFLLFFLFGLSVVCLALLLSTLLKRVKTAQTVGYGFILVGFVFQSILCSGSGVLVELLFTGGAKPWVVAVRYMLQCYAPFNFASAFYKIAKASSTTLSFSRGMMIKGPGFSWDDLYRSRHVHLFSFDIYEPAPIESYYWLMANAAVYGVLAMYLDQVLPGDHGSPRPFYYFLTPSYWGLTRCASRGTDIDPRATVDPDDTLTEDSDVAAERAAIASAAANDPDSLRNYDGVAIVGLSKTYASVLSCINPWAQPVHAVVSFCMRMRRGELFSIAGPNGAGKSTLFNMLSLLSTPSAGTAYVFGDSIRDNADAVRSKIGVCPQHDILFDELTAREHLTLFGKLKGLAGAGLTADVAKQLEFVELADVADHRVHTFSGGMKRRLSIAIAAMGDPELLIFDEPSTGCDIVTRASIWNMIQALKVGRVVLLTTHSMDEADVLSDRFTTVVYGRAQCLGTPLHVKNKYGGGYRLAFNIDPARGPELAEFMVDTVPGAHETASNAGSLTYKLPEDLDAAAMRDVLAAVEDLAEPQDSLVKEWSVSFANLEDVFLAISKLHGFSYEELEGDVDVGTGDLTEPEAIELADHPAGSDDGAGAGAGASGSRVRSRKSHPYRGLFRKNLSLQSRETFTNCCQTVTPVFVMAILVLLQFIIKAELGSDLYAKDIVPSLPWPVDGNYALADLPLFNTSSIPSWLTNDTVAEGNRTQSTCLTYFLSSAVPELIDAVGTLSPSGANASGLLGHIPQHNCTLYNDERVSVPYFERRANLAAMDREVYSVLTRFNGISLDTVKYPPVSYEEPDGFVAFYDLAVPGTPSLNTSADGGVRIQYVLSVNDNPIARYHRMNNFTRIDIHLDKKLMDKFSGAELIPLQGQLTFIDFISTALEEMVLGGDSPGSDLPEELALLGTPFLQAMPYYAKADKLLALLEIFGTALYPVALSLQLPVYIYLLVLEKSLKLREMMKTMGMRNTPYVVTNVAFFAMLYAIVVAFFWGVGGAVQIRFFSQTGPDTLAVFFVGWGVALIGLAHFFAAFISSQQVAIVVGYVVALIGCLIGLVVTAGIYGVFQFSVSSDMPWPWLLWPQMGLCRGIYLMNLQCAEKFACYGSLASIPYTDELAHVLLSLYMTGIGFFVAGAYLDRVLPQQFGIRKPWYFPAMPLLRLLGWGPGPGPGSTTEASSAAAAAGLYASINADGASGTDATAPLLGTGGRVDAAPSWMTADAAAERARVIARDHEAVPPVRMQDLSLTYPATGGVPPKQAVRSLSLVMESGQCFGLVGENGAGKTSTINMLTGMFPPTSGTAQVAGHDIVRDIDKAHLETGVCPQFDVLWETLTVSEHLLFYARLKGVSASSESEHVARMLSAFGLAPYASRKARELSGGMRRRLSVAISLTGHSAISFQDEPTTGVDPVSRRQLWDILHVAKRGRAICLTSHNMDEVELLAERIGIMVHGQLRALGTPLELKARLLDEAFKLTLNFEAGTGDAVEAGIRELLPTARLKERGSFDSSQVWFLGRDIRPSHVFEQMEAAAGGLGIVTWGLSEVGLATVFEKVIMDERAEAASHV